MRATSEELREKAQFKLNQVGAILGTLGWVLQSTEDYRDSVFLTNDPENPKIVKKGIRLRLDGHSRDLKIVASSSFNPHDALGRSMDGETFTAKLSPSRDAEVLANEIVKKVITPYLAQWEVLTAKAAELATKRLACIAFAVQVGEALGLSPAQIARDVDSPHGGEVSFYGPAGSLVKVNLDYPSPSFAIERVYSLDHRFLPMLRELARADKSAP